MSDRLLPGRVRVYLNWRLVACVVAFVLNSADPKTGLMDALGFSGGIYMLLTVGEWIVQVVMWVTRKAETKMFGPKNY